MKLDRALIIGLALCLTFAVARAQLELPGPAAPPLADDNVSCLLAGEFSGNTHADAVVVANGRVVLRESVETYQTYVECTVPVVDIARWAGTGVDGRDQVVAVGSGGLWILELENPGITPPWKSTNLRGTGTLWASAVAVRTGQVDGLHGEDIVAVTASRMLVALSDGSGGWSDSSFAAGANITGVELVDWDGAGGGALEIAVLIGRNAQGPAKLRLVTPTGGLLETVPTAGADRIVASPIATSGGSPRWLAAVSTVNSTGAQELALLSDFASSLHSLGALGIHDTAAADWNGDGIQDLLLGSNTDRDAWLHYLVLSGSQLTLDTATPIGAPLQLPVGNPNRPVSAQDGKMDTIDVDFDGDLDLVSAVQGTYQDGSWNYADSRFSAVDATRNAHVSHQAWKPWHSPGSSWPSGLPFPTLEADGDLTVPLVNPTTILTAGSGEVVVYSYGVWRTPTIEALADPAPVFGPGELEIGLVTAGGQTFSNLVIPTGETDPLFPDRYTLIVRQIRRTSTGTLLEEGPALIVTLYSSLYASEFSVSWNIETDDPLDFIELPDDGGSSSGPTLPPTPHNQRP